MASAYSTWGVDVLTMYWIDSKTERFVEGYHPTGARIFEKVSLDSELSGRDKKTKTLQDITTHTVYQCKWIVGTDYIYDYG